MAPSAALDKSPSLRLTARRQLDCLDQRGDACSPRPTSDNRPRRAGRLYRPFPASNAAILAQKAGRGPGRETM